jgi:hypothetical protein
MSSGRLFQTAAPETGKSRSPIVNRRVLDTDNRCDAADFTLARPTDANVKSVIQVGRRLAVRTAILVRSCRIPSESFTTDLQDRGKFCKIILVWRIIGFL